MASRLGRLHLGGGEADNPAVSCGDPQPPCAPRLQRAWVCLGQCVWETYVRGEENDEVGQHCSI